jgi:hypothetical protein
MLLYWMDPEGAPQTPVFAFSRSRAVSRAVWIAVMTTDSRIIATTLRNQCLRRHLAAPCGRGDHAARIPTDGSLVRRVSLNHARAVVATRWVGSDRRNGLGVRT